MKKGMFVLLLLMTCVFAKNISAQSCVVHIFSKGWSSKIYIDDKLITGLNKDEALEYTVTDGGRHTFTAKFADNYSIDFTVSTDGESDVYYIVYEMVYPVRAAKNKEVDLKEWTKESKNFEELVTMSDSEGEDSEDSGTEEEGGDTESED